MDNLTSWRIETFLSYGARVLAHVGTGPTVAFDIYQSLFEEYASQVREYG